MKLYNKLQGGSVDSLEEIKENFNEEIRIENEQNSIIKLNKIIDFDNNEMEGDMGFRDIKDCNNKNYSIKISERGRKRRLKRGGKNIC